MAEKCRKRNSLQRRFTLLFAFVFSMLLILLLVGNSFFLESLYENRKVHVLEKAYIGAGPDFVSRETGFSKDFPTGSGKFRRGRKLPPANRSLF